MNIKELDVPSLVVLMSNLNVFDKSKTIRNCIKEVKQAIEDIIETKENLKKAKVISLAEYKKIKGIK